MVALSDLAPASFRGARFLCPRDHVEQGRNTIDHHYPDSNRRYAEDNGFTPPVYHITAYLHGAGLRGQFNALAAALNTPGPGTLAHPWLGSHLCAVKGPWKVVRDDKDSGVLEIEITFLETSPTALFPGAVSGIAALVSGLSGGLVPALFAGLAGNLGALGAIGTLGALPGLPGFVPNAAVAALAGVSGLNIAGLSFQSMSVLSNGLRSIVGQFGTSFGAIAGIGKAMAHLFDRPQHFLSNPPQLAAEMTAMFRAPFEDIANTYSGADIATGLNEVHDILLDMHAQAAAMPADTLDYAGRKAFLSELAVYTHLAVVSSLAEAMAGTTYRTADAVQAAEQQLMTVYTSVPTAAIRSDTAVAVSRVVAESMAVLRKLELQLPRVDQVAVHDMPASVLAYMLYETDARAQTIIDLNPTQNPILLDRTAQVLIGT